MRGVTPSIYATLRPWICALPTSDLSPINVNTLRPDQAPLIAMLAPEQLSIGDARRAIAARPLRGYDTVADFWKSGAPKGVGVAPANKAQLAHNTPGFPAHNHLPPR